MKTISISKSTNSEIDAAVAEYVAGWTRVRMQDPQENPVYGPHLVGRLGRECEDLVPRYSTDANAVLPLLYQRHWEVNQCSSASRPIAVIIDCDMDCCGQGATFPLAACFALLRTHGVEVTE